MLRTPEQVGENKSTGYGVGTPSLYHRYPLPPPVSPLIYRVFTLSNRGDNAPTEIFQEKIGEIGTIFLIPIIWNNIRG
jgi:hypothetical protein